MEKREFAVHSRAGLVGAGAHHHRIGTIGGLAHFDEADSRQMKKPVDLQLELLRVQIPQPFAEAGEIAALDCGHPVLDRSDVAAIVEVELQQCEEQSDRRAEQEDAGEEARADPATQADEGAPCCPDPGERRRSGPGLAVILAGVRRLILHHANSWQRRARAASGVRNGDRQAPPLLDYHTIAVSRLSYEGIARAMPESGWHRTLLHSSTRSGRLKNR